MIYLLISPVPTGWSTRYQKMKLLLIFVGVVLLNCGHGQAKEKRGEVATPDGNYRYKLWRIWNPSKPKLLVIGCNPSNGDANYDDPTLREAKHFEHIFTVLHVCVF